MATFDAYGYMSVDTQAEMIKKFWKKTVEKTEGSSNMLKEVHAMIKKLTKSESEVD